VRVTIKDENQKALHKFVVNQYSHGHGSVDVLPLDSGKDYLAELEKLDLSDEEKALFGYMFSDGCTVKSYLDSVFPDHYKNKNFYHVQFPYRWENPQDSANEILRRDQSILYGVMERDPRSLMRNSAKRIFLNCLPDFVYIFIPEDIILSPEELNLSSRTSLAMAIFTEYRYNPNFKKTQWALPPSIRTLDLPAWNYVDASRCHDITDLFVWDPSEGIILPPSLKTLSIWQAPRDFSILKLPLSVKTLEIGCPSYNLDLSPYTGLLKVKIKKDFCEKVKLPLSVKKLYTGARIRELTACPEIEIVDLKGEPIVVSSFVREIIYLR
jgi:hypothetical protein